MDACRLSKDLFDIEESEAVAEAHAELAGEVVGDVERRVRRLDEEGAVRDLHQNRDGCGTRRIGSDNRVNRGWGFCCRRTEDGSIEGV